MKKLAPWILVLVMTCGVAGTLYAAPPTAGSQKTAEKLSRLMFSKDTYDKMLAQMSDGMAEGSAASGQALPPELKKKMVLIVGEALPYEELVKFNVQVYSARFSDKELNDLIAFYETPTGKKFVKELPNLMKDVSVMTAGLLPQRMPALMKKHGLAP